MQLDKRVAALPEQAFKQRESLRPAGRGCGEELGFEQALAKFLVCIGVNDDAAADAHRAIFAVELKRADGDIEDGLPRREKADGACIDAARRFLDPGRQLHGAHLGRSGDGAAGEERTEDFLEADFRAELAGYRRGHLPDNGIALDGEKIAHTHAAEAAQAAEIVAHQVDDHDVFAAVLQVVMQPVRSLAVFGGGSATRRGSLHGARDDAAHFTAALNAEEELRR